MPAFTGPCTVLTETKIPTNADDTEEPLLQQRPRSARSSARRSSARSSAATPRSCPRSAAGARRKLLPEQVLNAYLDAQAVLAELLAGRQRGHVGHLDGIEHTDIVLA